MIYYIAVYALTALVAAIILACIMVTEHDDTGTNLFIGAAALALVVLFLSGLAGTLEYFLNSSTSPLTTYARTIALQVPEYKGKLICEEDTLTFKGTHNVNFKWKDTTYQVAYPQTLQLSKIGTYCAWDIKATEESTVAAMRQATLIAAERVENTLKTQALPINVSPEELIVLQKLLNTLAPLNKPVVKLAPTQDGYAVVAPSAAVPNTPKAKIPDSKKESTAQKGHTVSQDIVRLNISAQ